MEDNLKTLLQEVARVVKDAIQCKLHALKKMELKYELPYSDWLFELVSDRLCNSGFAVFTQNKDCPKSPALVNEYVTSKSDLLFYQEKYVKSNFQAVHISLSQLSVDDIDECQLKAGVAEVKVHQLSASAENELFYNMFGEGAKLTTTVLCKGKRVELVTIYGILVQVHQHNKAKLFKLKIDFMAGICTFERCRKMVPFFVLFNEIVSILEQPE